MKVYVGNLSKEVTAAQLNELAVPYGTLVSAEIATERSGGASKGFGFLEYSDDDAGRTYARHRTVRYQCRREFLPYT